MGGDPLEFQRSGVVCLLLAPLGAEEEREKEREKERKRRLAQEQQESEKRARRAQRGEEKSGQDRKV